jgi:branched-subunit amino acid aminotransferase/4-amino-4-deoxychorismate lyase
MKSKTPYCYTNGKIVTSDKVLVSAYDIGLLRGYAIYEGITAFGAKPFFVDDHLKRFRKSAKQLCLKIPLTDILIKDIIETLIKKNKFERTNLKLILSGGNMLNNIEYDFDKPTFFILSEEQKPLPKDLYEKGAKLMTEEYVRLIPEVKTTNYITAVRLQPKRKKEKAVDILFVKNGKVSECSTSNIFAFFGNTLVTPKSDVLMGITRKIVIGLAKKDFKIEERDMTLSEMVKATEVFISGSYKDIMPIVKIDDKIIGDGVVGRNTKVLMSKFAELTKKG